MACLDTIVIWDNDAVAACYSPILVHLSLISSSSHLTLSHTPKLPCTIGTSMPKPPPPPCPRSYRLITTQYSTVVIDSTAARNEPEPASTPRLLPSPSTPVPHPTPPNVHMGPLSGDNCRAAPRHDGPALKLNAVTNASLRPIFPTNI